MLRWPRAWLSTTAECNMRGQPEPLSFRSREELLLNQCFEILLGFLQRVDACTDFQGWAEFDIHCTH